MYETDTHSGRDSDELSLTTSRRRFLTATLVGGAGAVSVVGSGRAQQREQIELGARTSGWVGVRPSGIEDETNPTLALRLGQRYELTIENLDGFTHNFAVQNDEGDTVVDSANVNSRGETETVTFTANETMVSYLCQFHPNSMSGAIEVGTDAPTATQTPETTSTQTETGPETDTETETEESGPPSFEQEQVEVAQGDLATVTVDLGGYDEVSIRIGSEFVNYEVACTAVDGDGDGEVTMALDTFVAGREAGAGVSAEGADDEIRDIEQLTDPLSEPLEATVYPITAVVDDEEVASTILIIAPRSLTAATAAVAPPTEPVATSEFREQITRRQSVATGDLAILEVEMTGLYASLDDLAAIEDETTEDEIPTEGTPTAETPAEDTPIAETPADETPGERSQDDSLGYELVIEEADVVNRVPDRVPLSEITILPFPEDGRFFAVVDSSTLEVETTYDASFTITDANPYVPEGTEERVETEFSVIERTVSVDIDGEELSVPSGEATISGTTTVAPGSELIVSVVGPEEARFQQIARPTVEDDGTWSITVDFSPLEPGTDIFLTVLELAPVVQGQVVSG